MMKSCYVWMSPFSRMNAVSTVPVTYTAYAKYEKIVYCIHTHSCTYENICISTYITWNLYICTYVMSMFRCLFDVHVYTSCCESFEIWYFDAVNPLHCQHLVRGCCCMHCWHIESLIVLLCICLHIIMWTFTCIYVYIYIYIHV